MAAGAGAGGGSDYERNLSENELGGEGKAGIGMERRKAAMVIAQTIGVNRNGGKTKMDPWV